ncbi:MAG: EAL domain-containing protein [Burkholderiales bacterium]|nr:EAL domain-containing protein [Burkholderiales bacterium]
MKIKSLRSHIIAFVFFLAGVQLAGFALIDRAIQRHAGNVLVENLESGERIFQRMLEQRNQQLAETSRVLAADFGLREAVAKFDRETVNSVLNNHGARIGANLMMLVSEKNELLCHTRHPEQEGAAFAYQSLIEQAAAQGHASAVLVFDDGLYQVVVVPVLAPLPIAWVAMGFAIDAGAAADLARLTALQISFAHKRKGEAWSLSASTLPQDQQKALLESMVDFSIGDDPAGLSGAGYSSRVTPLPPFGDDTAIAVLQRSQSQVLMSFDDLEDTTLLLGFVGTAICLFGSLLIARSALKPITKLAEIARSIGQGTYAEEVKDGQWEETDMLASAFDDMRKDIVEISKLVYKDSLTGLPNRVLFNDRLQQAVSAAKRKQTPMAVLMMDLDNFKDVNDTLGHHSGDALLRQVAERLSGALLRDADTIARLGGDEFAVLLPVDNLEAAQKVARRLLDALMQPFTLDGQTIDAKTSIGIAVLPEHGADANSLMRKADVAMYAAKRSGSGIAVYDPRHDEHTAGRLSLLGELRIAIERNELILHYQPGVDLQTGQLTHMEALVRWQHPQRGLVGPDQFIPFAETSGFIDTITREVLRLAIRQCAEWRRAGLPVTISVNISARDLMSPNLLKTLAALLHDHDILPRWIKLEITESSIMHDPARAMETLERLCRMGFSLSIDDFGTGYSSLAYLKKLPVAELKIDKSFVFGMINDKEDAAIVRSTIELGHNLGLKVVAEGVEDEDTLKLLKSLSCDTAQGYFLSRPMSAVDVESWLSTALPALRLAPKFAPKLVAPTTLAGWTRG